MSSENDVFIAETLNHSVKQPRTTNVTDDEELKQAGQRVSV